MMKTVKLPLRAMTPTRAENMSIDWAALYPVKNTWSRIGTETTLSSSSLSNCLAVAMPAAMSPMATAVTRLRNTVKNMVMTMTMRCSRWTRRIRVMNRQSMMSHPTLIRIPARTAWGMFSTYLPIPRARASRIPAYMMPEIGVEPPARKLTTVPRVAPEPGSPPINPAMVLPMP